MQTLEVVVIASIMVSAVTFVATFDSAPIGSAPTRDLLQRQAQDALSILYDTPVSGSNFGDNQLSVFIAQCLNNDCTNLTQKFDKLLPEGASYALYVSNGHDTYPVLVTREPAGEAVTARQMIEPRWSSSFVATATDRVDGESESLLVYSLPIFNSNPITDGGSPLGIYVYGTRAEDGSDYTLSSFATTHAFSASDVTKVPAASLYFVDGNGTPLPATDVTDHTIDGWDVTKAPIPFTLRLNETANVSIPAYTNLTVHMPRGWSAIANQTANAPHWRVIENATDAGGNITGSTIVAELLSPLKNGTRDFVFDATYEGDWIDYYPFHAYLSHGAYAHAALLVRGDYYDDALYEAPSVLTSVPRPMGATATTVWTLAASVPETEDLTVNTLFVDRIEIVEQDGADIFGAVAPMAGSAGGTWTTLGDRLVWNGSVSVTHGSPLNMSFLVTASGHAGAGGNRTPFTPPVTFDDGTGKLISKVAPGFYRAPFLPYDDYYGNRTGYAYDGATPKEGTVTSNATYRSTAMPGSTAYTSGMTPGVRDAIYGSYVSVDKRTVPVGGTAVFTTDVQSMLFALAQAGQRAGVSVKAYPPWSGDEREPTWEESLLDQGFFGSSVTQVELFDLNADGFPDPIVGTSNGRVFGIDGLSGSRLPGRSYTVPFNGGGSSAGVASVQHLKLAQIAGETYIVAGTDDKGLGVVILDTGFNAIWNFPLSGRSVHAVDVHDLTDDGREDILVATAVEQGSIILVLEATEGVTELQPYSPSASLAERIAKFSFSGDINLYNINTEGAFFYTAGAATALEGLASVGPDHTLPGLVTTMSSTTSLTPTISLDTQHPQQSQFSPVFSAPRAGLQGVDQNGEPTFTFYGAPVTTVEGYDYDGDTHEDLLAGGSSGYVFMLNGSIPTQPIYSLVLVGAPEIIDSDTVSPMESYVLTADGYVIYTDDGWTSTFCLYCEETTHLALPIVDARSISANKTGSAWVATPTQLYRSDIAVNTQFSYGAPVKHGNMMKMEEPPVHQLLEGEQLVEVEMWEVQVNDFTDVLFLKGADADNGWVIGNQCTMGTTCDQSQVLSTTDGGASFMLARHGAPDYWLKDANGGPVTADLHRIHVTPGGTGWIVGDDGTLLRSTNGRNWTGIAVPTSLALRDVHCLESDESRCVVVGDAGTAYLSANALADPASVQWTKLPVDRFADGKDLLSVGFQNALTGYIGARNAVLRTYDGGNSWTALPLNYIVNDAHRVDIRPDGTGYIYGGNDTNARIWFIGDYGGTNHAVTNVLTGDLPADANITRVELVHSNVTATGDVTSIAARASTNGKNWKSMGSFYEQSGAGRNWSLMPAAWTADSSGKDLRVRFDLTTAGDKTLFTPVLREAQFLVTWSSPTAEGTTTVTLDFSRTDQLDASNTTAWWNTDARALHQPVVQEYWVRNVTGEVHDIRTGYDITGDARADVWLSTGSVLAENSPDHAIYVADKDTVVTSDNRVYLLDGSNGTIVARTDALAGEVTHVRLTDANDDGVPEHLLVAALSASGNASMLYSLDPLTLEVRWNLTLGGGVNDLEPGQTYGHAPAAITATGEASIEAEQLGYVWSVNATTGTVGWRAMPDNHGSYLVSVPTNSSWLFGPYVLEVEVTWTTSDGQSGELLNSARFYDYFMVTPPDGFSPPSPIYDVHLVAWFDDWS